MACTFVFIPEMHASHERLLRESTLTDVFVLDYWGRSWTSLAG
jgi:hypothetical protein